MVSTLQLTPNEALCLSSSRARTQWLPRSAAPLGVWLWLFSRARRDLEALKRLMGLTGLKGFKGFALGLYGALSYGLALRALHTLRV